MIKQFHFFERTPHRGNPGGTTVSKKPVLPKGDFRITEYRWGSTTLWFVDADNFTADERDEAFRVGQFIHHG